MFRIFHSSVTLIATAALVAVFSLPTTLAHAFTFEDYFTGKTVAFGKFWAINGVNRTFRVDLDGTWDGKTLTLVEDFVYDDGVEETKIWYFTKTGEGQYVGRRDDVEGVANVTINGNTARYGYGLYLDAENRENLVQLKDKMVLLEDGTVRNTATVFKFGFPVGRVVVNFARAEDEGILQRP